MGWFIDTVRSSLGKKLLMAVTGIGLTLFLFGHLGGNFLLLLDDGGVAFNTYAYNFKHNPLIWIAEVVIFTGFIVHIIDGIILSRQNKAARPTGYAYKGGGSKKVSWNSKAMTLLGIILLLFFILHIGNFFMKSKVVNYSIGNVSPEIELVSTADLSAYDRDLQESVAKNDHEVHDLYEYTYAEFSQLWYTAIYVIAMAVLGLHLNHGWQSAFRTLGWTHPKYFPAFSKIGVFISVVVPAAFAAIPLYILFQS